jgi:glycosyltransferase involved in cell wall biosynthesis
MVNPKGSTLQLNSQILNMISPRACVSVIIPCYCCSETIGRALASVAAQTLLPKEVILVEDASPDNGLTLKVLNEQVIKYYDCFEMKIIVSNENVGAASARNLGWLAASQPYIAFLDADDAWHPEKIKTQFRWMVEHPEFGLSGHVHSILNPIASYSWPPLSENENAVRLSKIKSLFSNPFSTPTVMLKRDLPFKFKQGKRYIEDYLLWLEIILEDIPVAFINKSLSASYKDLYGSSGLSANLWKMEKGELDTYFQIYKNNKIGLLLMLLLSMWSLLKYVKRVLVVVTRTWLKKV